jgi:hypothetical protein
LRGKVFVTDEPPPIERTTVVSPGRRVREWVELVSPAPSQHRGAAPAGGTARSSARR